MLSCIGDIQVLRLLGFLTFEPQLQKTTGRIGRASMNIYPSIIRLVTFDRT